MSEVAKRLADQDPGAPTQQLEGDILKNLTTLRAKLEQELKRRDEEKKQPQQPQPKGPQTRKLVPPIAELKLLAEMQEDVNRRTKDLYDALQVVGGTPTPVQQRLLARLTSGQSNIKDVLKKMSDSLAQEGPGAGGKEKGGDGGDGGGDGKKDDGEKGDGKKDKGGDRGDGKKDDEEGGK